MTDEDETAVGTYMFEAYHLVYAYCSQHYTPQITKWLHDIPLQQRKIFFKQRAKKEPLAVDGPLLHDYLEFIESKFQSILPAHSPTYWLHLYRRIKPTLSPKHDSSVDDVTIMLVRQIADLAIAKHSDLENTTDLLPAKSMMLKQMWGGYLLRALEEIPSEKRKVWMDAANEMAASDVLLPRVFRPADLRNLYGVEGYAYEYWLATARLRTIGKGMNLWFFPFDQSFLYEPAPEISEALTRYDARGRGGRYFHSQIGIVTGDSTSQKSSRMLALQYNVRGLDLSAELGAKVLDGGSLTNFVPFQIDLAEFILGHSYLDLAFKKRNGISLRSFIHVLWAVVNLAAVPNSALFGSQDITDSLLQLLRRGYVIYSAKASDLVGDLQYRLSHIPDLDHPPVEDIETILLALDILSLKKNSQKKITPWSGGPRPIIIPYGDVTCIDVAGSAEFLTRIFFGVKDDGEIRGRLFEEATRTLVSSLVGTEYEWGPRKIKHGVNVVDEIDLLLRRRDVVFVCECFSMWRPLDYEIGKASTIDLRVKRIEDKIDQAMNSCEYFQTHPLGQNYDYREVSEFVPIVISPFIEWLPSTTKRYWISENTPRVMSLDEFADFLESRIKESKLVVE